MSIRVHSWIILLLCLAGWPAVAGEKIVCLGDSITDGDTYPSVIRQALADAGKDVPVMVNAGIGGDTAAGMLARLDRDVLVHKPTLVMLSVGINDSGRVPVADFDRDVTAIADQLGRARVRLVIFTTSILGPRMAARIPRTAEYDAVLRRVAGAHGAAVAEVKALMTAARDAGEKLLEPDDVHLSFAGYRVMTRAVLDALGHKDVAVPKELKVELMPGLITEWRIRPMSEKETLAQAAAQARDETWKALHLPQAGPEAPWWPEEQRRRGFAQSLDKLFGGKRFVAVATIDSAKARRAYLNTGAHLTAIRLNGAEVYRNTAWTGWHAGKERVAVDLPAGRSTVAIETGAAFFLSVTETNDW